MSFKMPLKESKRPVLKASAYVKMLSLLIKKKLTDGMTVPFVIILNQKYANLDEKKSAKLPLFLLGDRDSSWKELHKQKIGESETQKDYMISGMCTRQGNELILAINGSKGLRKIPPKSKQHIEAVLAKVEKGLSISIGSGSGAEATNENEEATTATGAENATESAVKTAATAATTATPNAEKTAPQADPAQKEEAKEEATALSDAIKILSNLMGTSLKKVSANVKKGATSGKDIKAVQEVNKKYDEVQKLYQDSSKGVQKKFAKAHDKLTSQKKELYKVSMAAKARKKSLAQRLADNYYQATSNRIASEEEITSFQQLVKDTISHNKTQSPHKVPQDLLFKATLFVAKKVGVQRYKPELTDKVLEKVA